MIRTQSIDAVPSIRKRRTNIWSADISDLTIDVLRNVRAVNRGNVDRSGWWEHDYLPAGWFGDIHAPAAEKVVQLLRDGDAKGAALIRKLGETAKALVPPPISARRTGRWEEQGDDLDRDRLLAGDIDRAWRVARRDVALAPLPITLVTPWGGNCHRSADQLRWNSAAALAASDLLEDAGYATEVVLLSFNITDGGDALNRITLKGMGQPCSLPSLAAGSHPAVWRTFGFAGICSAPWNVHRSLGYVVEPKREQLQQLGLIEPSDILLPEVFDERGAQEALRRIMAEVNSVGTFGTAT